MAGTGTGRGEESGSVIGGQADRLAAPLAVPVFQHRQLQRHRPAARIVIVRLEQGEHDIRGVGRLSGLAQRGQGVAAALAGLIAGTAGLCQGDSTGTPRPSQ